jgi:uncharacterized membrane protein SpoIIM required for sporulation
MKETKFIDQNKEKWKAFEEILESVEDKEVEPETLNRLFVEITDDLSYSRTFYPNRSVRVYLNNLAQQVFFRINKSRKAGWGTIRHFWQRELPLLAWQARRELLLSFLLFALSMAIGIFSSAMDSDFSRIILGDSYVEMTLENIEKGDPMAVYKEEGALGMSLGITGNNLFVAILTFLMGLLLGIGTIGILIRNGVMVGSFQYFFLERGLFQDSFLTIWMHGALEISAIVIAGAAGLTLGKGLVFPGTYTRLQAFQVSARRGMKLMLGIAPLIIVAGFIEGFFTRYTEVPDLLRLLFILFCFSFVLLYFVIYPFRLARKEGEYAELPFQVPATGEIDFEAHQIYTTGEQFSLSFSCFKTVFSRQLQIAFGAAFLFCLAIFTFSDLSPYELFYYSDDFLASLLLLRQFFHNDAIFFLPFVHTLLFTAVSYLSIQLLIRQLTKGEEAPGLSWKSAFVLLLGNALIQLLFQWNNPLLELLLFLGVAPFLFFWMFVAVKENEHPGASFSRAISLLQGRYRSGLVVLLFLEIGIISLFFLGVDTFVLLFYLEFIGWNVAFDEAFYANFFIVFRTFITVGMLYLLFPLLLTGAGIYFFTALEIKEAKGLLGRLENFGQVRKLQGLEKE